MCFAFFISTSVSFSHREEVAPLFGTGSLSLQDTAEQEAQQQALTERMRAAAQAALLTAVPIPTYGSTASTSIAEGETESSKPAEYYDALLEHVSGDDDDDEEDTSDDDDEDDHSDDDDEEQQNKKKTKKKAGSSSVVTKSSKSSSGSKSSAAASSATSASRKNKKKPNKKQPKRKSQQPVILLASGKPERPTRNCLVHVFFFIESFGIITCCCLLLTQVAPLVMGMTIEEIGYVSAILKLYLSLFSILLLVVEYDVPISFIKNSKFIQTWFSRGFLYSFLGLTCMQEAYSERITDMVNSGGTSTSGLFHVSWISLFMQVSSWMMVGLGVVYMILGVLWLQLVRDRVVQSYKLSWVHYREALKRYREETGE